MKRKPAKKVSNSEAWQRWRENRSDSFVFVYPWHMAERYSKGMVAQHYGIVQLVCVANSIKKAFLAGRRSAQRQASSATAEHAK